VELLSTKELKVGELKATDNENIEVIGQMLNAKDRGIYAMRIVSSKKKEKAVIGPADIQYNKQTGEFMGTFPPQEDVFYQEDPKFMELYVRIKPESIPYEEPSTERINVAQGLELCLKLPMEFIPDPRTIIEDAHDRDREDREKERLAKKLEEERVLREADRAARMNKKAKLQEALRSEQHGINDEDSDLDEDSDQVTSKVSGMDKSGVSDQQRSDDGSDADSGAERSEEAEASESEDAGFDDDEKDETVDDMRDLPSHGEMKRELIQAIEQAEREKEERLA